MVLVESGPKIMSLKGPIYIVVYILVLQQVVLIISRMDLISNGLNSGTSL